MNPEERLIESIGLPLQSRTFDVRGRTLHCMVAGSGPPLFLIHGLNIGWGQWYAVLPELARRYTVFAVDLAGAGAASKADFLSADIAELTLSSVDGALRELVPDGAVVVGHSIGGWAALKLASQGHPSIKALLAVNAVGFTDYVAPGFRPLALRPFARLIAATAMRPTRANLETFLGDVMHDRSVMSPEFVDYVHAHVTRPPLTHPLILIHRLFRPFRFRDEFVLTDDELRAISLPAFVLHGSRDPLIPLWAVEKRFVHPHAFDVTVLSGVGHVPPIEAPKDFIRAVDACALVLRNK